MELCGAVVELLWSYVEVIVTGCRGRSGLNAGRNVPDCMIDLWGFIMLQRENNFRGSRQVVIYKVTSYLNILINHQSNFLYVCMSVLLDN